MIEIKELIGWAVGIILALIALIWGDLMRRINKHEVRIGNHSERLQRIEDVQGSKIDHLVVEIGELKKSIIGLSEQIHKERNVESQLALTLTAILKHLEKAN